MSSSPLDPFAEEMQINGLPLPDRFIKCLSDKELYREVGSLALRATDAYGNPLESELGEVHDSLESIASATSELPIHFEDDGCYGGESDSANEAGYVPDIIDFSRIICFGSSSDGSPFCLDYREGDVPSVLWWDDVYWRRIAPEFHSFLGLVVR